MFLIKKIQNKIKNIALVSFALSILFFPSFIFAQENIGLDVLDKEIKSHITEVNSYFEKLKNITPTPDSFMLKLFNQSQYQDINSFEKKFKIYNGALRTNVDYYLEKYGTEDIAGVILYNNHELTDKCKKIMLELSEGLQLYTIATKGAFLNRYVTLECGIDSIYEKDWMFEVEPDHDFRSDIFYYTADPKHNPERKAIWTPVYYDEILKKWMTSLITPLYDKDEFLGITGGDLALNDVYNLIETKTFNNTGYSFLFDNDKNILVHPKYLQQLKKKGVMGEVFSYTDIEEKELSKAIFEINNNKGQITFVENGKEQIFIYEKLKDIDWYYGFILDSPESVKEELDLNKIDFSKKAIQQKAEDVAKQIEIYINLNTDKTLQDLQKDEYFQKIAVQPVGKTGYTAVADSDTLINRFHNNENIVNSDLSLLEAKLPGFWNIMQLSRYGENAEGVYDWQEPDGKIKQKYMYVLSVNVKTADGILLNVAATTYLDEYREQTNILKDRNELYYITFIGVLSILILLIIIIIFFEKKQIKQVSIKPIRRQLMIPFGAIALVFALTFFLAPTIARNQRLNTENKIKNEEVLKMYDDLLFRQSHAMLGIEYAILNDKEINKLLKEKNRQKLFDNYEVLFNKLKKEQNITHFYFHLPNRENLLRVHNFTKYGDIIDRFTTLESEKTLAPSFGVELGPLGTFTLRVVQPIIEDGVLIGYIEIGKEIEDLLEKISIENQVELLAIVKKELLIQEKWEDGLKMLDRHVNWEQFKNYVIMYSTLKETPFEIKDYINNTDYNYKKLTNRIQFNNKDWNIRVNKIQDVSKKEVGELFIFTDVTELNNSFIYYTISMLSMAIVVLSLILGLIYVLLGRVDKNILLQQFEIDKIKQVVDLSSNGIAIADTYGKHFYQNNAFTKLFGYSKEEVINLKPGALYVNKNIAKEMFNTISKGDDYDNEVKMIRKNGKQILIHLHASAAKDQNNKVISLIGIHVDITKQKQQEENEKRKITEIKKLNKVMIDRELKMIELKKEIKKITKLTKKTLGSKKL